MKILFYGINDPHGLCSSYMRACGKLGYDYRLFDYEQSILQNINYGTLGLKIHQHFSPENWVQKINRHFVVTAKNYQPDIIASITNAPVTTSALLFLKSILPATKFILIWPDSLLNFKEQTIRCLPLYDYIATYGSTSVEMLENISRTNVAFIPLAGDLEIHGIEPADQANVDVGFVGGWRPERQRTMEIIHNHFPQLQIGIHGPLWQKKCGKSSLGKFIRSQGLRGMEMARFFNTTRINVNTIDDTNFPSANMRYFEILAAGGLELVSSCPEMENIFLDRVDLLYFHNEESIVTQIEWILQNAPEVSQIKMSGHGKIGAEHNYTERLKTIISHIL